MVGTRLDYKTRQGQIDEAVGEFLSGRIVGRSAVHALPERVGISVVGLYGRAQRREEALQTGEIRICLLGTTAHSASSVHTSLEKPEGLPGHLFSCRVAERSLFRGYGRLAPARFRSMLDPLYNPCSAGDTKAALASEWSVERWRS